MEIDLQVDAFLCYFVCPCKRLLSFHLKNSIIFFPFQMAQNYGYEFLMTELPTYMRQILRFSIKENGILSSVPYLGMWISSLLLSLIADWLISNKKFSITTTRKILNTIGQFGPAVCLFFVSYTGCNRILTVFLLTIGISMNGGIYSGFKVS